MFAIYFFYGLAFWGLGFAAYLQTRRDIKLPLRKQIPWLAAFGIAAGATSWVEMFLTGDIPVEILELLNILRMILQPTTGLLLLIFGWGILTKLTPLPSWVIFIPGLLIVPIAFVIAYASTTFITPSPIEIPIDIWSRYMLYLPGSIMAGIGFLRQWKTQKEAGYQDVAGFMLGAGMAFLLEAFVVGLIVPVAPYGPASYYNYNRVVSNAFVGENMGALRPYGLSAWLDYNKVLEITHFPIQFWRMISAFLVTYFVSRGLNVFDAVLGRQLAALQVERDRAREVAYEAQLAARLTAENWTSALVSISRRIAELENVDHILLYIVETSRKLLSSDFIGLALLNDELSQLELKCYSNHQHTEIVTSPIPIDNPLIVKAFSSSPANHSAEAASGVALDGVCIGSDRPARSLAVAALNLNNVPIGALWIARYTYQPYTETDQIWLEALADQVDIAINHGVMTSQLQSLSITEERGRIAREMHDGLAQLLGYLNLQIQTLEVIHQQGRWDALKEELHKMRTEVQAAHADVRENILSLRTTLASDKGLIASIQEYLEEFSYQTGIEIQFVNDTHQDLSLPPITEIQLVCILQEALANVRKHAHCRRVIVSMEENGDSESRSVQMTIKDDGIGFVANDRKRHFGLATMHERAKSVNGDLNVDSKPGKGTLIFCRLPCVSGDSLIERSFELQGSRYEYS
jgi:signal transduction histidine kinase